MDNRSSAEPLEAVGSSRDSQWISTSTSVTSAMSAQFTTSALPADQYRGLRSPRGVPRPINTADSGPLGVFPGQVHALLGASPFFMFMVVAACHVSHVGTAVDSAGTCRAPSWAHSLRSPQVLPGPNAGIRSGVVFDGQAPLLYFRLLVALGPIVHDRPMSSHATCVLKHQKIMTRDCLCHAGYTSMSHSDLCVALQTSCVPRPGSTGWSGKVECWSMACGHEGFLTPLRFGIFLRTAMSPHF